jgi:hypothetical protein
MTPEALTRTVQDFLSDLLGYLSPEIDWEFVGIDEPWRERVRAVFASAPKDYSFAARQTPSTRRTSTNCPK